MCTKITNAAQKKFEAAFEAVQNTKPYVPELCGIYGRACRQMNKEEGANRALCFGCALKEFAEFEEKEDSM